MKDQKMVYMKQPLVVMFLNDDDMVECHLHPRPDDTFESYGLLACDLVRHIANAFEVPRDMVWEWVDLERHNPTSPATPIQIASPSSLMPWSE